MCFYLCYLTGLKEKKRALIGSGSSRLQLPEDADIKDSLALKKFICWWNQPMTKLDRVAGFSDNSVFHYK